MNAVTIAVLGTGLYLGTGLGFVAAALVVLRRQDRQWQDGYQEGWETRKVYDRERARARAVAAGVLGRDRGHDAEDCRWN